MITYQIKPGQKNFRPFENPLPRFGARGFELNFMIESGAWCSLEDWQGDRDYYDWQKLKGLTSYFSSNNRRTAMFAFRFGVEPETYQLVSYTNYPGKRRGTGQILTFKADELVFTQAVFAAEEAIFYYGPHRMAHDFRAGYVMREVGTYPGGANNADGPHGGRALKAMTIKAEFTIR